MWATKKWTFLYNSRQRGLYVNMWETGFMQSKVKKLLYTYSLQLIDKIKINTYGYDIIFIARQQINQKNYLQIKEDIIKIINRFFVIFLHLRKSKNLQISLLNILHFYRK